MKTVLLPLLAGLILSGCGSQPETPAQTAAPSATPTQTAAAAPGDPAKGKVVFEGTCVACHGDKGQGVTNLGKPLVGSAMLGLSDADLVAFIIKGRDTSDTANTTGVAMPPKGGNPALTEQDLMNVVAYLHTLK